MRNTEDEQQGEQPVTTAEKNEGSTVEVVVRDDNVESAGGARMNVAESSLCGPTAKRLREDAGADPEMTSQDELPSKAISGRRSRLCHKSNNPSNDRRVYKPPP